MDKILYPVNPYKIIKNNNRYIPYTQTKIYKKNLNEFI